MARHEVRTFGRIILASPSGKEVVVEAVDSAPTSGTTGTLAGVADTGSLLLCTDDGKGYINTNTKASPLWTVIGTQTT